MIIAKILNSPIINNSALAQNMFPTMNAKAAKSYLFNKMNEKQGRRLSFKDKQKIIQIMTELFADTE